MSGLLVWRWDLKPPARGCGQEGCGCLGLKVMGVRSWPWSLSREGRVLLGPQSGLF